MTHQLKFDANRTAFIGIDLQREIVGADGAFAPMYRSEVDRVDLIPTLAGFVGAARPKGVRIFLCRGAFSPGYPDLPTNIPVLRLVAEYGVLLDGSPGAELVEEMSPREGDYVFTRHRVSCFQGTPLDNILRGAGIENLIVAGVDTALAVSSTARAASDLGYTTVVLSDGCTSTTEASHKASLESLSYVAEIMSVQQVLDALTWETS